MILEHKILQIGGKIVFDKLIMESNFRRMPKHFVENEACFLFLSRGAFQLRTPTNVLTFTKGEAMLAKCGNYFFEESVKGEVEGDNIIEVVSSYFHPDIIKNIFTVDINFQLIDNEFDASSISVEPLLKSFIDSIEFLLNNPKAADENLLLLKLKELIILISKTSQADKLHKFIQSLFSKSEYDFRAVIEANLFTNIKLEELAYLANMSVATFKRRFKATYNESSSKYFQQQKVLKAKQLLKVSSMSVTDVCYELGFDNLTSFNRIFKKNTNQSPSVYKLSQSVKSLS